MSESTQPWVCPWGICNHQQAQECRAEMRPSKGCGGRFPPDMTPEEAANAIKPRAISDPDLDRIIRLAVEVDHQEAEGGSVVDLRQRLRAAIDAALSAGGEQEGRA